MNRYLYKQFNFLISRDFHKIHFFPMQFFPISYALRSIHFKCDLSKYVWRYENRKCSSFACHYLKCTCLLTSKKLSEDLWQGHVRRQLCCKLYLKKDLFPLYFDFLEIYIVNYSTTATFKIISVIKDIYFQNPRQRY